MKAAELMISDVEAWVRLIALERDWGRPRDEILALALHECKGVRSDLNAQLDTWLFPDRNAVLAAGQRLFESGGWSVRRKTDD
ncbi:hypothetical protein GCM10022631_04470 [Deinococcus rubellus]|uniref:hypothetical protein n=1 Tax=Deinococcus rubellus TaxID=1889240 RepID=UPI0031E52032